RQPAERAEPAAVSSSAGRRRTEVADDPRTTFVWWSGGLGVDPGDREALHPRLTVAWAPRPLAARAANAWARRPCHGSFRRARDGIASAACPITTRRHIACPRSSCAFPPVVS